MEKVGKTAHLWGGLVI